MTDSKKPDLLLEKVSILDEKVTDLDERITALGQDMAEVKIDLKQLHHDDSLIPDEVERVHEILLNHLNDMTKHTV